MNIMKSDDINEYKLTLLTIAHAVALAGPDTKTKVGAVLYNPHTDTIEASSVNWRIKDQHAESYMLLDQDVECDGFDMYVSWRPCKNCQLIMKRLGVRHVYYHLQTYEKSLEAYGGTTNYTEGWDEDLPNVFCIDSIALPYNVNTLFNNIVGKTNE